MIEYPSRQHYKGPNGFLELAKTFSCIKRLIDDDQLDNDTSNNFWQNSTITDLEIAKLLKFGYGQYMENACRHSF